MKINYSDRAGTIAYIRDYIIKQRALNPAYRVLDIGGSRVGWTADLADLVVDLSSDNMQFDLCIRNQWQGLLDLVAQEGVFDLCICTHTIEDLYNPVPCLEFMPVVARAGFVSVPSVQTELSHCESKEWRGYIHHRWMLTAGDALELVSKLEFVRLLPTTEYREAVEELVVYWQGSLPYRVMSYLGPTADSLLAQYREWTQSALHRVNRD